MRRPHAGRVFRSDLAMVLSTLSALFGIGLLFLILFDVTRRGMASLTLALFTEDPAGPMGEGGLKGAFLGQGMLTLVATLVGAPIGILVGTYLSEYGKGKRFARVVLNLCDLAMSLPSIVVGIFVYAVLVKPMGGFNGWAGSAALAIIMIPLVTRTTESMLSMVSMQLREAALALGAPYYKMVVQIVWRKAASGILTGILLAIARIAGETAPLMFTSLNKDFFELSMSRPVPSITVTIFNYAGSPYERWIGQAWGAALAVTGAVLFLSVLGRVAVRRQT